MDWGQPYSCTSWATTFGQSFPILDDGNGYSIYSLFGVGYVPHNVVIGGDGLVIFSESGFNQNTMIAMIEEGLANLVLDVDEDGVLDSDDNCVDISNPSQNDIDLDGAGDACDPCDNLNIFTYANIDGNIDTEGNPIIDIFDVMRLVDILLDNDQESCGAEIADMNSDGNENVVDIISLVQLLLGGGLDNLSNSNSGIFEIENLEHSDKVIISSDEKISGIQFEADILEISEYELNNLLLPNGWILDYAVSDENILVIIFDISGENSLSEIELHFDNISKSTFQNVVVSSDEANEINISITEKENDDRELNFVPTKIGLNSLYPNPFNPTLNIAFSTLKEGAVDISVYNAVGEEVSVLYKNEHLNSGSYTLNWNAVEQSSGVYFIKIATSSFSEVKKAILVK
ncbi:MAG: hypothetical protein CMG55_07400 [Candidatus Marinimicrobia bacterium]|nr:hypothetical protein [Candidatus Neomarinimicrobiota bacterium]